jgi:hypothetical protein
MGMATMVVIDSGANRLESRNAALHNSLILLES